MMHWIISKKRTFIYQILHTFSSKGIMVVAGFLTGVVTSRMLGPEGKGILTLFLTIPTMIISLGELGIRQSTAYIIGRGMYREEDIQSSLMTFFYISAAASFLVILASYHGMGLSGNGLFLPMVFSLLAPFTLFQKYSSGILLGKKDIESVNWVQLGNVLAVLVLLVVLLWIFRAGLTGAGVSYLLGQLGTTAFLLVYIVRRYGFRLKPSWTSEIIATMFRKGIVFALSLFVLSLNYRLDILMLAKIQGDSSVGIYSVGVGLCELLKTIPLSIGMVLFSRSVNLSDGQIEEILPNLMFTVRVTLLTTFIMAASMMAVANWLVPILYGQGFKGSATVIWYLCPGVVLLSVFLVLNLFLAGQGKPYVALYAFLPALLFNAALNVILIPQWNYIGAAVSSTISYSAASVGYLFIFKKLYPIRWNDVLFRSEDTQRIMALLRSGGSEHATAGKA